MPLSGVLLCAFPWVITVYVSPYLDPLVDDGDPVAHAVRRYHALRVRRQRTRLDRVHCARRRHVHKPLREASIAPGSVDVKWGHTPNF